MTPKRIQRQRTRGWKKPDDAVYVGRPTKWGNPFAVRKGFTAQQAVDTYRWWLLNAEGRHLINDAVKELRGKNLMCWCAEGQPCHADVLIEIANK